MTSYSVFLEIGPSGECMAHVLDLPGCFARADSREAALAALPAVIANYREWLGRHGEPVADSDAPTEVRVAEVSTGFGPFERGDPAALFAPEREPLSRDELERLLRLAGYNRGDLLTLTRDLPAPALDWKPEPAAMSVREILRHVGNAEQWYVSRIVDPETLPAEWADDEHVPIFAFLDMERETAVERLRRLTDRELADLVYPTRWTNHPDEPWTARKVLRRMLEHEREHIEHIRNVLASYPNE